jgi:hypothetical protein
LRHELGSRLRIRRIPDLHVELDDTAERGTRVLRLLSELEAGVTPEEDAPLGESLPTPVARLPHAGDLPEEPPSAARLPEPTRKAAARTPGGYDAYGRSARPATHQSMTIELEPFLEVVPEVVIDRLRGARHVLAVSHENPDADTIGRRSVSCASSRPTVARPTPCARTRYPPCTGSCPASSAFGSTRPDRAVRPARDLDCGSLDRIGAVGVPPRRPVRAAAAGRHRPSRLERRDRRRRLDRPGGRGDLRDGRAAAPPARDPARSASGALADGLMAGIVMDTATFAHPNATPGR